MLSPVVAAGAAVDKSSATGRTPLYCAAEKGFVEIVRLLLAAGADKSLTTNQGYWTPLKIAEEKGKTEVVSLLQ